MGLAGPFSKPMPRDVPRAPQRTETDEINVEEFWSHVEKTPVCWVWHGAVSNGHGRFRVGATMKMAARVAWELEHGEEPTGALHKRCETALCIKPSHYYMADPGRSLEESLAAERKPLAVWLEERARA